ncbi:hypothetical protein AB0I30_16930 [Nocardia tengchongensis]|uniref:hypothetical protein n=1 Tax=Nocardia tengchongensis TaxID=2055889 RepID=UPI0033ECED2F
MTSVLRHGNGIGVVVTVVVRRGGGSVVARKTHRRGDFAETVVVSAVMVVGLLAGVGISRAVQAGHWGLAIPLGVVVLGCAWVVVPRVVAEALADLALALMVLTAPALLFRGGRRWWTRTWNPVLQPVAEEVLTGDRSRKRPDRGPKGERPSAISSGPRPSLLSDPEGMGLFVHKARDERQLPPQSLD